jgi:colanic acid biosynthesis glycosyl transferase WcaI
VTTAPAAARRRRYLVITQLYHPEPNFITADVAEALAVDGDVTVVTTHPNYPHGRFYPGAHYRRIQRSRVNGVTIWRVPMIPDHSLSPVRRAISYVSFAVMAAIVAPLVGGRPDVVWVYQTPFTTALAALWFKFARGARLVYTCADLWPESFAAAGVIRSGLLMRTMAWYNRTINRAADAIICSTRGTKERFRRDGVPETRLVVVPVWIGGVGELAAGAATDPETVDGAYRVVYTGNLGPAQNLGTVIAAAAALREHGAAVEFHLFGSGASEDELKALAIRLGATNVIFHGRVPLEQAFSASAGAAAQIVCLQKSALFRMTVPSKMFAAFAAASPLLYALEGDAAALAVESGGGIPFDVDEPESLVRAVLELLALSPSDHAAMRRNLRHFFLEHFHPDTLVARYRVLLGADGHTEGAA